jgi:hypothetical protein
VIIVVFVVELARGHDGSPLRLTRRVVGVAYPIAVIAFRLRGETPASIQPGQLWSPGCMRRTRNVPRQSPRPRAPNEFAEPHVIRNRQHLQRA